MKMPSDDQANSVIPQTRFRVHGNTLFLSRKRASGNAHMEKGPNSIYEIQSAFSLASLPSS